MASITLETLDTRISTLGESLNQQARNLSLHIADAEDDINTINGQIRALQNADTELHQENHDIEVVVNSNEQRIDFLENKDGTHDNAIIELGEDIKDLQDQIEDMDIEHHEELHLLAHAIDNHSDHIERLHLIQAAFPEMEVMTEEEYEALGTPEPDVFYFTYEE